MSITSPFVAVRCFGPISVAFVVVLVVAFFLFNMFEHAHHRLVAHPFKGFPFKIAASFLHGFFFLSLSSSFALALSPISVAT